VSSEKKKREFRIGKQLFAHVRSASKNPFTINWLKNNFLKIATYTPKLQQEVFRFVDVLPSLKTKQEITSYLSEYLEEANKDLGMISATISKIPLIKTVYRYSIRTAIYLMADSFICGSNIKEAKKEIEKFKKKGFDYTLDILGELTVSNEEALEYFSEYRKLISSIPNPNLSIKLSALAPQLNPLDFEDKKNILKSRLRIIFREAILHKGFINIDTEHYYWKDFCFELLQEILTEQEFQTWSNVGIVIQAYLKSSKNDLRSWIDWAKKRGTPIAIRLVKGAYWDYETAIARQQNWDSPVFTKKFETDINYEDCSLYLLENYKHIRPAFASHNFRSLAVILSAIEEYKIPKDAIEFQMLYGMLDEFKSYFTTHGYKLRVYMPYGELIPGMAYLVRRLLENTANDSFLKQGFLDKAHEDELLKDPRESLINYNNLKLEPQEFENAANLDFSIKKNRKKTFDAIKKLRQDLPKKVQYPILINGEEIFTESACDSINPAHKNELLGKISLASRDHCDHAVNSAASAHKRWSKLAAEDRALLLECVADLIEKNRFRFNALMCLEAGKPWLEADGETSEAIDFLRYYAVQARQLFSEQGLRSLTGEKNTNIYQSYGVSLIISPWNFPLGILCGMMSANLVCGNSVIIKPSSQTCIIAFELIALFQTALRRLFSNQLNGLINFLPGEGRVIGDYLVSHPLIRVIAFTGSNETGMRINDLANKARPVKKLIAEMGGKNAIIIDDNADLDEAIPGVLYSAFGYAGQKCSACSRLVILEQVYDEFLQRFKQAIKEMKISAPELGDCYMGPQIDAKAQSSINQYIEQGKKDGKLFYGKAKIPDSGFFVSPSVFTNISEDSKLFQEEIFGPVLVVLKANNLDHALSIVNNSSYGLTGGFYSRSPKNIRKVISEFQTGNLYINRSCTGAIVSRQAFGGLKESSLGYKAGGPNYLLNFVQEKTVTENTMRRGFASD
jgi:RHH-type transcriptional regulator, proline utilization regulon repressor / proline dehydrogenase / delta 1-pyrroline-5-carboxylate dehydrogenase